MNTETNIPQTALTAIYKIIDEEGGFVYTDHPVDPDQGTYAGIRFNVFEEYMEAQHGIITPTVFKEMALAGNLKPYVLDIYFQGYFQRMHLLSLPTRLILPVFSCGINCGTRKAIKILQKSCNEMEDIRTLLKVDGINGKRTSEFVHRICTPPEDYKYTEAFAQHVRNNFVKNWIHYYCKIVAHNPKQIVFLLGWFNRANKYWVI